MSVGTTTTRKAKPSRNGSAVPVPTERPITFPLRAMRLHAYLEHFHYDCRHRFRGQDLGFKRDKITNCWTVIVTDTGEYIADLPEYLVPCSMEFPLNEDGHYVADIETSADLKAFNQAYLTTQDELYSSLNEITLTEDAWNSIHSANSFRIGDSFNPSNKGDNQ